MGRLWSVVFALCVTLALAGCASRTSKTMASWVGHDYSELVMSWGAPHREAPDGKGGRIIVYEYRDFQRGTSFTYTREFFIDDDDKVYSWRWQNR